MSGDLMRAAVALLSASPHAHDPVLSGCRRDIEDTEAVACSSCRGYQPPGRLSLRAADRVTHLSLRCYTCRVPTTRPRYNVTDTGAVREMLDLAQRRWPDVPDRKQLLLRLAAIGREAIARDVGARERKQTRELQLAALARAEELVDAEALLTDAAWH